MTRSIATPAIRRRVLRAGLLPMLLLPLAAHATNGYFAHGYSASQRALGGAGTAMAEDALAITVNPAASARLGSRWDANLSLFVPLREVEAGPSRTGALDLGIVEIGEGKVESQHNLFAIPGFAWVAPVSDRVHAGLAIYGNGGLNTVYKEKDASARFAGADSSVGLVDQLFGSAPTEGRCQGLYGGGAPQQGNADLLGFCGNSNGTASVDLIQLFVAPNLSYKVTPEWSLGVSPLLAVQRFEAKGLAAFARFSNSPDRVSDKGFDFSYGAGVRLGVFGSPLSWLDVGASWQSRVYMSRFREYEGLFAERGDFDVPSNWNAGIALKPTANQKILFDYQRIDFNDIASVGGRLNPERFVSDCALPRLLGDNSENAACLGAKNGPGFGWQDIDVYKVGYQLRQGNWAWRAGYSQTRQPIPSSETLFNLLAPGVVEKHYTLGSSWQASKRLGFDLSLMYAPSNPVKGRNPLSRVSLASNDELVDAGVDERDQMLTLDMKQYELTLGMSYTY